MILILIMYCSILQCIKQCAILEPIHEVCGLQMPARAWLYMDPLDWRPNPVKIQVLPLSWAKQSPWNPAAIWNNYFEWQLVPAATSGLKRELLSEWEKRLSQAKSALPQAWVSRQSRYHHSIVQGPWACLLSFSSAAACIVWPCDSRALELGINNQTWKIWKPDTLLHDLLFKPS